MTLTEFLQAREADREQAARVEWLQSLPPEHRDERAVRVWDETVAAAGLRLQIAVRQAGWVLTPDFIKREAAVKYAGHPDYDEAWRP